MQQPQGEEPAARLPACPGRTEASYDGHACPWLTFPTALPPCGTARATPGPGPPLSRAGGERNADHPA